MSEHGTDTTVSNSDLYTMLHCAIGYAFGRRTYITGLVSDTVQRYWPALSNDQRHTLTNNLRSDIADYDRAERLIGDQCDDRGWRNLIVFMEANPYG